jgi:hypothetical protein
MNFSDILNEHMKAFETLSPTAAVDQYLQQVSQLTSRTSAVARLLIIASYSLLQAACDQYQLQSETKRSTGQYLTTFLRELPSLPTQLSALHRLKKANLPPEAFEAFAKKTTIETTSLKTGKR